MKELRRYLNKNRREGEREGGTERRMKGKRKRERER